MSVAPFDLCVCPLSHTPWLTEEKTSTATHLKTKIITRAQTEKKKN